jgi:hypothetical protein
MSATRADLDFVITLTLDLIFFKDSVNIFDPAFNVLNSYGVTLAANSGPVGMELPEWASASDAIIAQLTSTVEMIGNKLKNNAIDWSAIVGASTELRNAASTFFASSAGSTNEALTRIFRPSRVVRAEHARIDVRDAGTLTCPRDRGGVPPCLCPSLPCRFPARSMSTAALTRTGRACTHHHALVHCTA